MATRSPEYTNTLRHPYSLGMCPHCKQCKPLRLHPELGRYVKLCKPCRRALNG